MCKTDHWRWGWESYGLTGWKRWCWTKALRGGLLCGAHASRDDKHTLNEIYDKIHLKIQKNFHFWSKGCYEAWSCLKNINWNKGLKSSDVSPVQICTIWPGSCFEFCKSWLFSVIKPRNFTVGKKLKYFHIRSICSEASGQTTFKSVCQQIVWDV